MSVAAAFLASGCTLIGAGRVALPVPDVMTVTSTDLSQGLLGRKFTCYGAGGHPGIRWSGAPPGTKSIAVVLDDSSAPITPYIYWVVFNIGPQTTDIQAGQLPAGAQQAANSKGTGGYDPPCPANGGHQYRITVYALDHKLRIPSGTPVKTAWTAISQTAIARGRLDVKAAP